MKLELTEGCICDSLTVDGIEEIYLSDKERKKAIKKIAEYLSTQNDGLNQLLQWFLHHYGEWESDDKPCECCGDWIYTYKLKI